MVPSSLRVVKYEGEEKFPREVKLTGCGFRPNIPLSVLGSVNHKVEEWELVFTDKKV
jgi:hypothetical protein